MKEKGKQMNLDRLRGMFAGAFLGDARGAPHEFICNRKTIYTGKLEHVAFLHTQFQGKKELSIGQITDDSEMTLTLMRQLVQDKTYNRENVILAYLAWANSGVWMMGKNTRALLKGVKTIKGYQNRMDRIEDKESLQSNGAMMRCSPLALFDNYKELLIQDASITNPSRVSFNCNLVYILALRLALLGYSPNKIYKRARKMANEPEVIQVFEDIDTLDSKEIRNVKINKGWCCNALWCTMYVCKYFDLFSCDYDECIRFIIKLGGDTDTNACIAGALIGAMLGYKKMMNKKNVYNDFRLMCDRDSTTGPTLRPREYSLHDFKKLTKQLFSLFL